MVKVLITNATILTMSGKHEVLIDSGYVFIRDGLIEAVGRGEVPEDYQYPELLLSGRGRLVIPGMSSGFTRITTYPLRYALPYISASGLNEYLSVLTRTDVYYIAVLAFTDLLYRGVTNVMVSDLFLDDVARAASDVGLYTVLAVPINAGLRDFDPYHELKLVMQRWHGRVENVHGGIAVYGGISGEAASLIKGLEGPGVKVFLIGLKDFNVTRDLRDRDLVFVDPYVDAAEGQSVVRTSSTLRLWRPFQGLGIGDTYTYDLTDMLKDLLALGFKGFDLMLSATKITSSIIGFDSIGCIEEGRRANIVMLNLSEPPGWPLLPSVSALINAVLSGRAKVESVVVGDNILVDGGETLSIGSDLVKKATSRIEGVLRDLRTGGRLAL